MQQNIKQPPVAHKTPALGRALSMIARRPIEPSFPHLEAAAAESQPAAPDQCKQKCRNNSLVAL